MDYFIWQLDEPGNKKGIVLAYDEDDARDKVFIWLGDYRRDPATILIEWLSSDATDVIEIDEL